MTNTLGWSLDGIRWTGLGKTLFPSGCIALASRRVLPFSSPPPPLGVPAAPSLHVQNFTVPTQPGVNTVEQTDLTLPSTDNSGRFATFTKDNTQSSSAAPNVSYSTTPIPSFKYTAANGASKASINLKMAITNSASAFFLRYILGTTVSPWYDSTEPMLPV
jgi:hypothetical protein